MTPDRQENLKLPNSQPKRYFSTKLFNHVLREYLRVLLCCLGAFLTLFIVASIYDDLEDLLKHNADLRSIIYYMVLLQPQYLINVIPISLLIATLYVFSNLCRYHELTAIRASGVSILQTGLPILSVAMVAGISLFVITEKIAPATMNRAQALKEELSDPYQKRSEREKAYLAFRNKQDRRDWFFKNFNANGVSYDVNVTQFRADRSVAWELVAQEAEYKNGYWQFRNSVLRRFDNEGYLLSDKPQALKILDFSELTEDPKGFSFLFNLRPLEEYSATSLYHVLSTRKTSLTAQTASILRTYFYYYLFLPFSCFVSILIGLPLAIIKERASVTLNFILAAGLFALFHLLTQCFVVLGKNQVVAPFIAGATPLIIFIGLGILLLKKKV